jgi:hypothetical protein
MKNLKIQRKIFVSQDRELTKTEYDRLLRAAAGRKDRRLFLSDADYLLYGNSCV